MTRLANICDIIDRIIDGVGNCTASLVSLMVILQFAIVLLRHIFGYNLIFAQESVTYLHSAVLLVGASFALQHNRHVRIDVFYRNVSTRWKAAINSLGYVLFLLPVCAVLIFHAGPYAGRSWEILEGSREVSGVQLVFILKTMILLFALMLAIQGLSGLIRSMCTLFQPKTR